ncbi:bifunctional DNA primase/polymerase [Salipiger thiooxidans]|uniref:bifunctional DNA primase/polymerase n=1 Tax=Salipiger thiooxidans TaxID=282683 RepID=UPI000B7E0C87
MTPGDIAERRRNCSGYLARRADHRPAKPVRRRVRSHVTGWQDKATTDPDQLRRWWRKWPDATPAIPAGSRSGIAQCSTSTAKMGRTASGRCVSWGTTRTC